MNTKRLLLFGIISIAIATLIKTVLSRMEIFEEETQEQDSHSHDEEMGIPLFI